MQGTPGLNHLRETYWCMVGVTLRTAPMFRCASMIASWIAMDTGVLPPCPRGRWCARVETVDVQYGFLIPIGINFFWRRFVLDDPPYTHEGLYDHGDRSK